MIYFVGQFVLGISSARHSLFVPTIAAVLAGATGIYSIGAYILVKERSSFWAGIVAFIALSVTVVVLISLTGGVRSPFIALWLLIGVFTGLFGRFAWVAFWVAANLYAAYEIFFSGKGLGSDTTIELVLVAEAPLIASFIIWHAKQEPSKDSKAFSALEAQLSQVANKSEIVINSIADGVVAIDANGVIQLINPAAQTLLGWPKQDAIGLDYKSVIKLTDPTGTAISDEVSPIRQVMLTNTSTSSNDLILISKSRKKVMVSLMVSPVGDSNPSAGAIAVFRDITHEKEQERQKAEFISTASHEMRTPVAAIEGYLGLALNPQTAAIDEKARAYLQKAHESAQHLGRLFQDLLTVSKAEDSRLIPHPTAIDVTNFTREITEGLSQKARDKGIFLNFAPGQQDGNGNRRILPVFYTFVDVDNLREVLNNLVDNGIKYTRQGSVTVDITGDTEHVVISVADTGLGIPPEDLPHLFQKFYRVDNTDTREIGGTGLGLYISRRLIEANNGQLSVRSAYGQGSTFYIQLPRITVERATEILNAAPPAQA